MARLLTTLVVLLLAAGAATASAKPPVVKRTIGGAGAPVPRSFAGLSLEYTSASDYLGPPGKPNQPFIELLRTLGANGVGAPTIRIGGNSADGAWWNPDGQPRPAGVDTDLTPDFLRMLKAVNEGAGSHFVLGGNLAIADPANAVAYVKEAVATLAPEAIDAFAIGNEPDLYDRAVSYTADGITVTRIQHRPVGYGVPQYLAELDSYITALNAARTATSWPALAVGGFARHSWQVQAPAILDHVGAVAGDFEAHAYPLNRCRASHVPADRWRKALLGSPGLLPVARMTRLVRDLRPRGVDVRFSEFNSATCGGALRVSDSFASALWATDLLFGLAEAGVAGTNLHTWSRAWYAPIDFGGGVARVRPLLYGLLLFDRAVANDARLLKVTQRRTSPVKVWATRDSGATVRVVVINKYANRSRLVRLKLPRGIRSAKLERLRAHTLASRSGVTLGGRSFEGGSFDGRLHGTARTTRLEVSKRRATVAMPPASAALLTARR
jgi:hypothetical protein